MWLRKGPPCRGENTCRGGKEQLEGREGEEQDRRKHIDHEKGVSEEIKNVNTWSAL